MRPDKKKTRHHDSRKREAAAKSKLAGESSSSAATKAKGKGSSSDRAPEEEEGSHSEEKQEDVGDDRYSKRKVQSNWTKYEIPSSEGEDDEGDDEEDEREMTGPDFNYVLQNASEFTNKKRKNEAFLKKFSFYLLFRYIVLAVPPQVRA